MAADVTILAALLAGLVSFLSPCVLPLVPPYLVYLAGTSLERLAEAEPPPRVRRDTVIAAVLFVLGFSTVFVTLGASASAIGALMRFYSNELAIIAGIIIIVMGLHFLGVTPIAFLHRQARLHVAKPVGLWGAYVIGLAFALGWTPCVQFGDGLRDTVAWYRANQPWVDGVRSGEYRRYYERQYGQAAP